ncbi:hypothetical protein ACS0TY_034102 [Phlomoides rotata]
MLSVFSVDNYDIWKFRMEAHLVSIHDEMWEVMENGPIIVTWPNTTLGGDPTQPLSVHVPKPSKEFTSEERKRANLDRVANNILQNSVGDAYLGRIRMCKTTKEIWETLTLMCEGTDKIKENMMFTNIMNEINSLGKEFLKRDVALKILRSLLEKWDIFTVMFQNTKDLSSISSDQLFSELRAHEFDLNRRKSTTMEDP